MSISRRKFLRTLAATSAVAGAGTASLCGLGAKAASVPRSKYGVLVDVDRCVGCRTCERACRDWNRLECEEEEPADLSPGSYTVVTAAPAEAGGDDLHTKWQCMHCVSPTCVTVCPAGALRKTDDGPVLWNKKRCIGCRYCVIACPFSVPRFDWEHRGITKCVFCADRLEMGLEPACVESCPERLFTFGERDELLTKARAAERDGIHVYGDDEIGGVSWMYLSKAAFSTRKFPEIGKARYSDHSKAITRSQLATVAVGALGLGLYSAVVAGQKTPEPDDGEGEGS